MGTTATPPGNNQAPPIAPPPVERPPIYGPGPPAIPPPPARGHWYRRGWVIGLAALLVGGVIGVAAGSSKTAPRAKTVTAPAQTVVQTVAGPTKTRTLVHVRTVPGPTTTVTGPTTTVTQTIPAPTSTPPTPTTPGGSDNTFTGNGSQSLGTINVPSDSTLTWQCATCTATGMLITSDLNADGNAINVYQNATSGQSAISAGTYTNVDVNADGPFTITIR